MKYSLLKYALPLAIAGCSTVTPINISNKNVQDQNNYTDIPVIDDCTYVNNEELYKNIGFNIDITNKDCALTKVAITAMSHLEKVAAEVDFGAGMTDRKSYNAESLIKKANEDRSFRRALNLADRDYNGRIDSKEADLLTDFLNY